jgi:hypothetical protein
MNTLTLTRVTKDMGTTIKPGPMVVAPPEQAMTDAQLKDVAAGSGLNGPFIADLVVAMAAHENMAINMYRALQNLTTNPLLKSVFADFEEDSLVAVGVHARLMTELGIPMYYISPAARLTEGLDSHMIMSFLAAGSADPLTIDLKTVEAVLLGATMCVANTSLLRNIANEAEGPAKAALETAVAELEGPQMQHLEWAQQTQRQMVMTLVKHPATHKLMEFTEKAVASFKRAVGKSPV